jgi:hypothetical protein
MSVWRVMPAALLFALVVSTAIWALVWTLLSDLVYLTSTDNRRSLTTITQVFKGSKGHTCIQFFDEHLGSAVDLCDGDGRMRVKNPSTFDSIAVQKAIGRFGVRVLWIERVPDSGQSSGLLGKQ